MSTHRRQKYPKFRHLYCCIHIFARDSPRLCLLGFPSSENAGYAQVHHLRPLGFPHRGRDVPGNMLVLCPNCRVEFHCYSVAIEPRKLRLVPFKLRRGPLRKSLYIRAGHHLDPENLIYAWGLFQSAQVVGYP